MVGISSHACLIQSQITFNLALCVQPLAVKVFSPKIIHSCHLLLKWSLNGLLMQTSRGWSKPVIPPGITVHSMFYDCSVLRIGGDRCKWNQSHTSINFWQLKPPTLLQTVSNQSFDRSSFIHPFLCVENWLLLKLQAVVTLQTGLQGKGNSVLCDVFPLTSTFTTPFSKVPTDKLHPQFLATIFGKKMRLICGFLRYTRKFLQ